MMFLVIALAFILLGISFLKKDAPYNRCFMNLGWPALNGASAWYFFFLDNTFVALISFCFALFFLICALYDGWRSS